jgi:2-polyprenyl-6-methoxyphenol hydroxylase-like FAD-dependent oxidoreductase
MPDHAVVIAGGGPTGLMLASELALAGVDVVIVERRTSQDLDGSRSGGLHARTIEVLDQRGVADRFLSAGETHPVVGFAGMSVSMSDFPTRHNYLLALWQRDFERILADWVLGEIGVPILRGCEVVGCAQDDNGVDVELSGDTSLRGAYLVGCDGGRSLIRKAAGIDFPGWNASTSWIIAEVEMAEEPRIGVRRGGGIGPVNRATGGGPYRVVLAEPSVEHSREPTLQDLSDALIAADGTDDGVHSPTWISRFTDACRQAASYRKGRVLLAGDAAHIHGPQGGQGLNVGVQDAVNLGWKLAQVVNATSADSLLDTYHAERHPVAARVLHNTMAQVALGTLDDRHQALRDITGELLGMDEPRRYIAGMISGLDIHYDLGEGHPILGRRMPDLDLHTAGGPTRAFTLLHDGRPVLLNLDGGVSGGFDIARRASRVKLVSASYDGAWKLPVLGEVAAPRAVLIRPDGHVAWVGDLTDPALPHAVTTWFGAGAAGDASSAGRGPFAVPSR